MPIRILLVAALLAVVVPPARAAAAPTPILANIDDDGGRCRAAFDGKRTTTRAATAKVLARCVDAGDRKVNGARDARDLVVIEAGAAAARVRTDGRNARLFLRTKSGWSRGASRVTARAGQEIGIEALRPRGPGFDGRFTVHVGGRKVAFRVAPVVLDVATSEPESVIFTAALTDAQLKRAVAKTTPLLKRVITARNTAQRTWEAELRRALDGQVRLRGLRDDTTWVQDIAEAGTAQAGSASMRVLLRAPEASGQEVGGRLLFERLLGRDAALVQVTARRRDRAANSANGSGNVEALPSGPVLVGAGMDSSFQRLLDAQGLTRLEVDTSWLSVGHVDEILSVVPAATARGWALGVADPVGALELLRAVPADTPVRVGTETLDDEGEVRPASATTAAELLADDSEVRRTSEVAAARIAASLDAVLRVTGLQPADVVRMPVLFGPAANGKAVAWSGNFANGIALRRTYVLPLSHAIPAFDDRAREELARVGVTARPIDTFPWPHALDGEIHCQTLVLRRAPTKR